MVSDEPRSDRCGADVTDRLGFEVHDEEADETYVSSERLEKVVIERGSVRTEKEAEYDELISYLNNGFSVASVKLFTDDSDELVEVEMEDDDPYTVHHYTEHVGFCERYQMDNGRCYVHGGANDYSPPEGNVRGMTHGLRAKRSNYYDHLSDEEKGFIQEMIDSWMDNAPFDRDNTAKANEVYRIAIDQHRLWNAHNEFEGGLTKEQVVGVSDSGEPIEVEEEKPVNLAYDRLDKANFKKLRDLGCLDDPESQQAEATESLADKFDQLGDS